MALCRSDIVDVRDGSISIFGQWRRLTRMIPENEVWVVDAPLTIDNMPLFIDLAAWNIITGICQDSRIMDIYNNPSFGYSGYCLPKDTKQLTQQMSGISGTLVAAIDKSNELRKQYIADQIVALYWEKQNTYKGPVGIYDMKIRDYAKESMLQDLLSRIQAAGISVLLFCHAPSSGPEDGEVETDISTFADRCSIIIANRFSPELEPYKNKLYCRDIFNRN